MSNRQPGQPEPHNRLLFLSVSGKSQLLKEVLETKIIEKKIIDKRALHRNEETLEIEG